MADRLPLSRLAKIREIKACVEKLRTCVYTLKLADSPYARTLQDSLLRQQACHCYIIIVLIIIIQVLF